MRQIYLDYNATTPIAPSVQEAMLPFLTEHYGNPSSSHVIGRASYEAVEDARGNAERNGIANHTALAGDVRVVLRENRGQLPEPDVAIVDPPRAGLSGGACRRILELAPRTLVYVSCQPATFADNARRFVDGGYRLEWVRPVDMFPQTPHIEAVARFTRA